MPTRTFRDSSPGAAVTMVEAPLHLRRANSEASPREAQARSSAPQRCDHRDFARGWKSRTTCGRGDCWTEEPRHSCLLLPTINEAHMTPDDIRRARETLNRTPLGLAVYLGVPQEAVEAWEQGAAPIPKLYAEVLAFEAAIT